MLVSQKKSKKPPMKTIFQKILKFIRHISVTIHNFKHLKMKPKQLKDEQISLINTEITHLRKDIADMKDKNDPDSIFDEMSRKVDQLIKLVSEIKLEMETALDAKSEELKNSSSENVDKVGQVKKEFQCSKCRCSKVPVEDSLSLE